MARPVRDINLPEAMYDRLQIIADQQHVSVSELLATKGVEMLLGEYGADLPRLAADLVDKIDWETLGRISAAIQALAALRSALPRR